MLGSPARCPFSPTFLGRVPQVCTLINLCELMSALAPVAMSGREDRRLARGSSVHA